MSAREAILRALASPIQADAAALAREAAMLLAGNERPPLAAESVTEAFLANLSLPSIGATHDRIASMEQLPDAVARYLAGQGEPARLYLPPDPRLDACDWSAVERLPTVPMDGGAALAIAVAAVAETGSLVLDTATTAPMLPNFLALHHLIAIERARLVRWLEDVPLPSPPGPRQRTWVTGVSGTTDIEGQYVRGAHGPRFLHVVLIG